MVTSAVRSLAVVSLIVGCAAMGGVAHAKQHGKHKAPGPIITSSASSTGAGSGTVITATAGCPPKTTAISGGFNETTPNSTSDGIVFESRRATPRSWRASTQILGPGSAPVTLITYAYCRARAPRAVTVAETLPTAQEPVPLFLPTVTATCTRKYPVPLAGGFGTPPPVTGGAVRNFVAGTGGGSGFGDQLAWRTEAISNTVAASSMTTYAYCTKAKPAQLLIVSGISSIYGPGPKVIGTTPCPAGRNLLSGGFSEGSTGDFTAYEYFHFYESRRADDGRTWLASGIHEGTDSGSFVTFGYCGR